MENCFTYQVEDNIMELFNVEEKKYGIMMNHESALDKEMMLELLSGAVLSFCLKKTTKFPNSFMVWGCSMSGKGPGEMAILTSTVNAQMYIEILDTFLIPSIEKTFGDNDVIFQDDNASCHRAKSVEAFLQERDINSMTWPANNPDLNPIEIEKTAP
uniref:Tc1-like transposase DDE domain-containing protein n=1 Tax=Sinocyclocheilus grahami TaxID=75366 RepID=A0A672T8Q8_SINGR